jgi:hypothetical protein
MYTGADLRGPSDVAGWLVSRSDPVAGRTAPVAGLAGPDCAEAGAGMVGTDPVGRLELPVKGGAPVGTLPVPGLIVPVVRLTESKKGFTVPLGDVVWPDGGNAPVAGRVAV